MHNFKELKIWQDSMDIVEDIYKESNKDFRRFLSIALSSAFELETQLIIASHIGFIKNDDFERIINKINEVQKMIFVFRKKLV